MITPTKFSPIGFQLEWLARVDSTNNYLKQRAAEGAPHGLAVIADEQTGGRGRFGRTFESPAGKGLYLSVLLRPPFSPAQMAGLTPWAAVAVCRAVETLTGLSPRIKWINDILLEGKKLCGILTEADIAPDGRMNHVILGIGVNLTQTGDDFTPEVAAIATSLARHMEQPPSRRALADALLLELDRMWSAFPRAKEEYLTEYRARCVTVGQAVTVTTPNGSCPGVALKVEDSFALTVQFSDGTRKALDSGEVSVQNMT